MSRYPNGIPADVCDTFERFARELLDEGFERYSADAILHRVRWHWQIERGDRGFKVNNNWSAPLARWFVARYPHHSEFFAMRTRKAAPIRAYAD